MAKGSGTDASDKRVALAAERAAETVFPILDVPGSAAPRTSVALPVWFEGERRALCLLLIRRFPRQLATLGLSLFWQLTLVRRYSWARTGIGTDGLRYDGTGLELLRGFAVALAFLLTLGAVAFAAAEFAIEARATLWIGLGFIFLFFLQYAVYTERRYRLSRTSWRGMRAQVNGSAFGYALRAFPWAVLLVISGGLAYPWAKTAVERLKMQETAWGNATGDFVGEAGVLFQRFVPIWLVGIVCPITIAFWTLAALPPELIGALVHRMAMEAPREPDASNALDGAWSVVKLAMLAPILSFPALHATVFRWRMNGIRLGGAAFESRMSIGLCYRVCAVAAIAMLCFVLAFVLTVVPLFGALFFIVEVVSSVSPRPGMVAGIVVLFLMYLVLVSGLWIVKQLFFDLPLTSAQASTLSIRGVATVEEAAVDAKSDIRPDD